MKYGASWRNITRATTFFRRLRDKRGARRLSRSGRPVVHGARKRPSPPHPVRIFCSLVLPPLVVSAVGLFAIAYYKGRPHHSSYIWKTFVLVFLIVVCFTRISSTTSPLWIRITAIAAGLIYPLGLVLRGNGIWP